MCCYIVVVCPIILGLVYFNDVSRLVALCYQFCYIVCPAWFVLIYVTPWDVLLSSVMMAMTDFTVVLVSVSPELQAL